ncbi:MAG: acyl-[acyl-carrier-protein] thioesterase [Lachnospiraceae bacterium]|nr:acyl-[acyl-carrier-protein] thioesterase [Lachnospiraceae bacterium]
MYTFDSRIRFSEVDSEEKLTMSSLLKYFQDCSTFQSEDIGLGVDYLREHHRVWVLSSWQIVVEKYPRLCDRVKVGTLPYDFKGFLGSRNFAMLTEDGQYLAKANSLWSLLDTQTGRPVMPDDLTRERYVLEEKLPMDYAPRKIVIPEGGVQEEPVVVKRHHLDTNHHVNNGQYVNMASEYLPAGFDVRQMRAEYKMQAFLDDVLYPYVAAEKDKYVISLTDQAGKPYVVVEFLRREEI